MNELSHYPVTVPSYPPRFKIDTRESRAHHHEEHNVDSTTSCLTISRGNIDKKKEINKVFKPSMGRVEISSFTNLHLSYFEIFFSDQIEEYDKLNFTPIKLD